MISAALPPVWALLLRMTNPASDLTSVPIAMMGTHMQISQHTVTHAGDEARAAAIVAGAKNLVLRYADVKTAERDGYRLFHEESAGNEEHYVNYGASAAEKNALTVGRPGSLLYRRNQDGSKSIVGVMYGAPASASAADLDARAPLSVASWHRHVDFCVPTGRTPAMDPRFGFAGTVHTADACKAAGGYFLPVVFGWMLHVYPNETTPSAVWGGMQMGSSPHGDDMDMKH